MKSMVKQLLLLLALCCASARAEIISYTDSGTFSASTVSRGFTGPSETWALSFEADRNPVALAFDNGGVSFAFSDFNYFLNGSPVAISPTFIRFFSATNGGGFEICFNGGHVLHRRTGDCELWLAPDVYRTDIRTDVVDGSIYHGCRRPCEFDCLRPAKYYR